VASRAGLVVIGAGNPMRGDDAAGVALARRLRRRDGVRVLEQSGEATALVEALRGARAAIVLDAAAGTEPGRVTRFDVAAQPLPRSLLSRSTHGFGVADGIELARALGALPPACVVYALEGVQFDTGAALSAALEAALPEAAARVESEIEALLAAEAADA
jgi:hydrogenase maturation protease